MFQVRCRVGAINQNIVEEYQDEIAHMRSEYGVHKHLKGRQCIATTKRYHQVFIVAIVGAKCRFMCVFQVYPNLMVP